MARIRTLKPEVASDKKLATASRDARYTFILLITQADDEGLIAAAHRQLLGTLYPHDESVTTRDLIGWVEELVQIDLLRWRVTVDGAPVLEITNWAKHQRVDNKSNSRLAAVLVPLADSRGESPRTAEVRGLDLGPGTVGPGTVEDGPRTEDRAAAPPVDRPIVLNSVDALLSAFEFGAYAGSVSGVCRAARNPNAVVALLRMHLESESGHEPGTPAEIGMACQALAANGEPFKQALFAGYLRRAKTGANRSDRRKANAHEDRFIANEDRARADAEAEKAEADALLEAFAKENPDRYRELVKLENSAVPTSFTAGREDIIRARLITAIRRETPKVGAA